MLRSLLILCAVVWGGCASPPAGSSIPASATTSPTSTAAATVTTARGKDFGSNQQATTNSERATQANDNNYIGFYELSGRKPKGFDGFGNFVIRAVEGGAVSGGVVPIEGDVFEFERATLDDGEFAFTTAAIGGTSYSFNGGFTASPPFAANAKASVLEGTLKKFQNGRQTALAGVKFYYAEGGGE